MEHLAKEMDELKRSTNHQITEKYEQLLSEKDEELRVTRQELIDAKGRIKDQLTNTTQGTSSHAAANDVLEKLTDELRDTKVELNTVRNEQLKYMEELTRTKGKLQNAEIEKRLADSLLNDLRKKMEDLTETNNKLLDEIVRNEQRTKETNELWKANLEISRELEEKGKESMEKVRVTEEATSQVEPLKKKVRQMELEAEDARITQQELVEKMKQEISLLQTSLEEGREEIAKIIQDNELVKLRFSEDYDTLRQEHEWLIVSKFATLNALADELERLRKSRGFGTF